MNNQNYIERNELFEAPKEKGSREWHGVDGVAGDHVNMFTVKKPREAKWPRYANVVHINRYPQQLKLRFAQ